MTGIFLIFLVLLFFLALLLLGAGRYGPVPPSPEVLVFVNDEELHTIKPLDNVKIKRGEVVQIIVQVYYQGEQINPGEFTYQWCFDPPVNDNQHCSIGDYRSNTNGDYKPENSDEQKLEITISHDILRTSRVPITFEPE
jgi:hypothetical protein